MIFIKKKDKYAVIVPIILIILLGIGISKIDEIFPTPSATGKMIEIMEKVDYTESNATYGTNPNASVTFVEFSDFSCPACAAGAVEVDKVLDYYGDRINFVYKHFTVHESSKKAAQASECARDQGKFIEYHQHLFANPGSFSISDLERYAHILGLDTDKFMACLTSGIKETKIEIDMAHGLKIGVPGTPTFFINGQKLVGVQSFETFKKIIDAELEK